MPILYILTPVTRLVLAKHADHQAFVILTYFNGAEFITLTVKQGNIHTNIVGKYYIYLIHLHIFYLLKVNSQQVYKYKPSTCVPQLNTHHDRCDIILSRGTVPNSNKTTTEDIKILLCMYIMWVFHHTTKAPD